MDKDKKDIQHSKVDEAKLFGLDEEISLQSVNFATTENDLLNEHFQGDGKE
jgi:hypothetical protein